MSGNNYNPDIRRAVAAKARRADPLTPVRKAARLAVGARANTAVQFIDGASAPVLAGEQGYYLASGDPATQGYYASTLRVEVGRDWRPA